MPPLAELQEISPICDSGMNHKVVRLAKRSPVLMNEGPFSAIGTFHSLFVDMEQALNQKIVVVGNGVFAVPEQFREIFAGHNNCGGRSPGSRFQLLIQKV